MSVVWFNGRLFPQEEKLLSIKDRGFLLGDGLFETMRCKNGRICHFDDHMHRLSEGCALLGLPHVPSQTIGKAIQSLLVTSSLDEGSVRLTLTRGEGPRGLFPDIEYQPNLLITAASGHFSSEQKTLIFARHVRRDEQSILCRVKNTNGLTSILARREAIAGKVDDAVLLNTQGHVAEGTVSNILVLKDGQLLTPPVSSGALPGIARKHLIEKANVILSEMEPSQLYEAQAVWLCNVLSLHEICEIEGRKIRCDRTLTNRLKKILE